MTPSNCEILISPAKTKNLALSDILGNRELLWALTWRNIHVHYKQAVIGILWVLLRPLMMVAIYTVIFGIVAKLPSIEGIPYSIMVLSGMVVWLFVAQGVSMCSVGFLNESALLTRVYFPRVLIPISQVLPGLVDFSIVTISLLGLMLWWHVPITGRALGVFPVIIYMIFFSLGFGLLLGSLTVRFRDFQHLTPFILQIGFYLTPVVYSSNLVPPQYRWLYYCNPAAAAVDGMRWSLLGQPVSPGLILESLTSSIVIFFLALFVYRFIEPIMTDEI